MGRPGHLRRPVQAPTPTRTPRPGRRGSPERKAQCGRGRPKAAPGSVPSPLPRQPPAYRRPVALLAAHRPLPFHAAASIRGGWGGLRTPSPASTPTHIPLLCCFCQPIGNWGLRGLCGHKVAHLTAAGPHCLWGRGDLSSAWLVTASGPSLTMSSIAQPPDTEKRPSSHTRLGQLSDLNLSPSTALIC